MESQKGPVKSALFTCPFACEHKTALSNISANPILNGFVVYQIKAPPKRLFLYFSHCLAHNVKEFKEVSVQDLKVRDGKPFSSGQFCP